MGACEPIGEIYNRYMWKHMTHIADDKYIIHICVVYELYINHICLIYVITYMTIAPWTPN